MKIRSHVRDRMKWAPTKPPYRVEVFNPEQNSFYVSGAACNLNVGIFASQAASHPCLADVATAPCGPQAPQDGDPRRPHRGIFARWPRADPLTRHD